MDDGSTQAGQQYLANGFLDENGQFRQALNGYYALGIACSCRDEGVNTQEFKKILDNLKDAFDENIADVDRASPLTPDTLAAFQSARDSAVVRNSRALRDVFTAAAPFVQDWRNYAALISHLERILEQTTILQASLQIRR